MKKAILYTVAMAIIALVATSCEKRSVNPSGATSCGKRTPPEQVEYFEGEAIADFSEADLDDSPPCGCEDDKIWDLYLSHTHVI
jgi:hypothetical protein